MNENNQKIAIGAKSRGFYAGRRLLKTASGINKKKLIVFFVIISAVVAGIILSRPVTPELNLFEANTRILFQEVSLTGRTRAAGSVVLNFERSGRIVALNKYAGDRVNSGTVIASLDNARLEAELAQAEATARLAEAELQNVFRGARPEEINVQRAVVENAKLSIDIASRDLQDRLADHQGKISEIMFNNTDRFFTEPQSNLYLSFNIRNYDIPESQIEAYRRAINSYMSEWISAKDERAMSSAAMSALSSIRDMSDALLLVFREDIITDRSLATINKWRADTEEVRAIASTASTVIAGARERYISAINSLAVAERNLALKIAGPTSFQIESASARIESARAAVNAVKAEIRKGQIISPINGTIGKIDIVRGEAVTTGREAVTIISDNRFEIETHIPEADIAKIKVHNPAKITLDAYGSEVIFDGSVTSIDLGETIVGGVTFYRAVVQFSAEDERIKPGMTANIDVMGDSTGKVIAVPRRAIISDNDRQFLNIWQEGNIIKTEVTTGFRSSDGFVEITSGLSEGNKVLISRPI